MKLLSNPLEWKPLKPLPLIGATVVSHCGTLLAIGGLDEDSSQSQYTYVDQVYAYNARMNSWVQVDKLPFSRYSMTVVTMDNNDIIVVGGWEKGNRTTCVMRGTYILAQ